MERSLEFGNSGGLSPVHSFGIDRLKVVPGSVTFDNQYPAGGEELLFTDVFPARLAGIVFEPKAGYVFEYDYDNSKVKIMEANAAGGVLVETSKADQSALTAVRFLAWGY